MTLNDVKTGLLSEELRDKMKEMSDGSSGADNGQGLFAEKEKSEKKGNRGRSKSKKPGGRGKSKERNGKCFICKKPGHWKNDCPDKGKKEVASSSVAVERDVGEGDVDVLSAVASDVSGSDWVLDSGASYHMTPNRNCFSSYVEWEGKSIVMVNGAVCKSKGIGSVQIRMFDGVVRTLTNVRYDYGSHLSLWDSWIL